MAIWEHIRNSLSYRLYANVSPEDGHSNHGSGLAGIILRVVKDSRPPSIQQLSFIFQHFCSQIINDHNNIHTYIHNWSLQAYSPDYDLASHTSYVVCVNFLYISKGRYSLKSTRNDRFLKSFSW